MNSDIPFTELTSDQLERRSVLKGITLGAGGPLLAPLLQKIVAAAEVNVTPPEPCEYLRFLPKLILAFALAACCCSQGIVAQEAPFEPSKAPKENQKEAADSQHLRSFLDTYCVRCHNAKKQSGKVTLDQWPDVQLWQQVFAVVDGGEMPPEDAKQPPPVERAVALRWMRQVLKSMGVALDESATVAANRGNSVDHDALFGTGVGKAGTPAPSTRARLWRLTPKAYENFLDEKIQQFQLDLPLCSQKPKEYGFGMPHLPQGQLKAPWSFTPQWDFTNYAQTLRVGESEIEIQLRNAKAMADAILLKFAGKLRNGKPISPSKIKEGDRIAQLDAMMKAGKATTSDQVRSAVSETFSKILGREPDADELARYSAVIQKELEANGTEDAARQLLIAVLCTPRLVYRVETTGDGRRILAPHDLARAIAFTLTDSEPDATLLQAAKENRLTTVEQVREQVVRILDDKTIEKPRLLQFFREYFGHHAAKEVFKDEQTLRRLLPNFGGRLVLNSDPTFNAEFFVNDTDQLIRWVIKEDKDVLHQLLTTNKIFVLAYNPDLPSRQSDRRANLVNVPADMPMDVKLAAYERHAPNLYEIGDYDPKTFTLTGWTPERIYDMPAEHRMGILTHPSWLMAQSSNTDNHPIHRGKWIREKLLGQRIPDVPITVDAKLPDEPHNTLRTRMQVTREEYCWKCHKQMDPLGLPFEQFNHVGRFRTTEEVVDNEKTNDKKNLGKDGKPMGTRYTTAPLDTTGVLDGTGDPKLDGEVKDPFDLIRRLAASQRVEQVFVRHVFRFFMGRNETVEDGPVLVAAHQAYRDSGGSLNALLASLLTSDSFLSRTKE
ncbi:hypothetical protein ETAA8_00900 [Anatilimnocola aggregata]|uniref:Haem-binding domain-containing protein n=1 Tax=Anatilimnocola aggregata TaxID=2528021 RepID=A0A517Y459_9BACT|nr:DUF1588 domain-containing protein [Anatilimnocola aggregata]QDU25029.1 hypothetical protein ETAA8_00900 [Anatilimnocola aggregata]